MLRVYNTEYKYLQNFEQYILKLAKSPLPVVTSPTSKRTIPLNSFFSIYAKDLCIIASGFKNKTRYTPYVSPGSQISHIATNKGNINRQRSKG